MISTHGIIASSGGIAPFNGNATLSTDLLSYYKLADINDSVGANTLTNNSATFVAGKIGNGVDVASSAWLNLGVHNLAPLDRDWSCSGWFKASAMSGTDKYVFSMMNTGSDWIRVHLFSASGYLSFSCDDGTNPTTLISSTTAFDDNAWHFFVVTRVTSTNTWKLYVDNVLIGTDTSTDTSVDSTDEMLIGAGWNATPPGGTPRFFFDGLIDEMGFWEKTLTVSEVSDLWNAGAGLTY